MKYHGNNNIITVCTSSLAGWLSSLEGPVGENTYTKATYSVAESQLSVPWLSWADLSPWLSSWRRESLMKADMSMAKGNT